MNLKRTKIREIVVRIQKRLQSKRPAKNNKQVERKKNRQCNCRRCQNISSRDKTRHPSYTSGAY